MRSQRNTRKYRNSLDFVETAFRACLRNASDLVSASKALIAAELHAPALALAVLAMEEVGKLLAIDGLLFARGDDHKAERFHRSGKDHNIKLNAFALFPMFVYNVSTHDPRYGDQRFRQTLAIAIRDWQRRFNVICDKFKFNSLTGLDVMKQKGLYSGASGGGFVAPRDAVDQALSDEVCNLAWRAGDTLEFLLSDDGLKCYLDWARSMRTKASEEEHKQFEELGKELFAEIFDGKPDELPEV